MKCVHYQRRGFTLLEMAMILMAVGLVTTAIWVGADKLWSNYRAYRVNQQTMRTVQNIRDFYGTTIQTWAAAGDITGTLDGLLPNVDIFPTEMRRDPSAAPGAGTIDHAINNSHAGGSFHVVVVANPFTGLLDAFRVRLMGLTTANCISLLMSAPLTSDTIGFVQVQTADGSGTVIGVPATINKGVSGTANVTPMAAAKATTMCTGAAEVDYDFTLHN